MTFQHLSENPRDKARAWNIPLGVPGFRYADLNRVRRLEALDRAFLEAPCGTTTRPSRDAFDGLPRAAARSSELEESKLLMARGPPPGPLRGPPLPRRGRARRAVRARPRRSAPLPVEEELRGAPRLQGPALPGRDRRHGPRRPRVGLSRGRGHASARHRALRRSRARAGRGHGRAAAGRGARSRTRPRSSSPRCVAWTRALAFHPALARATRAASPRSTSPTRPTTPSSCPGSARGPTCPSTSQGPPETRRYRDGFDLTDPRFTPAREPARGPLLHHLPRARQGLLLDRAARQGRAPCRRTRSGSRSPAARSTRRSPR